MISASMRMRPVASVVVIGALVGALAVSSLGHRGSSSSQLQLNAGTAWFADVAAGTASLLDGATASRVTKQYVSNPRSGHSSRAVERSVQLEHMLSTTLPAW